MSELSLNGDRVVSAQLTIGRYGPAVADVVMATSNPVPSGEVTFAIGSLALKGRAFRTASFAGSRSARFVGGAAGWRKTIKSRAYSHDAGVRLSTVLGDAARDAGETLSLDADRVIGTAWIRDEDVAEKTLHLLVPRRWWINPDGVTVVGPRPSSLIVSAFTVINWSGGKGRFEIATDVYQDWLPGRRFAAPTVTGEQTISVTQLTADNDGKLRLVVMSGADSNEDRLLDNLRYLIRGEVPSLTYAGVWEYTIDAATSSTIDGTPTSSKMPAITNCPLTPGLLGEGVTPTPGSKCRVQFVNNDPSRPECISIVGTPLTCSIDATATVRLGAGALPVARAGDLATIWPIIPTQAKVLA